MLARGKRLFDGVGRRWLATREEAAEIFREKVNTRGKELEAKFKRGVAEAEHVWMASYYQHRSSEYFSTAVVRWMDRPVHGGYWDMVSGFFSGALADLTDEEVDELVLRVSTLHPGQVGSLALALRFSGVPRALEHADHFRALLQQNFGDRPEFTDALRTLKAAWECPQVGLLEWALPHTTSRTAILKAKTHPWDALGVPASIRSQLDALQEEEDAEKHSNSIAESELHYLVAAAGSQEAALWGRFFATGDTQVLQRLMEFSIPIYSHFQSLGPDPIQAIFDPTFSTASLTNVFSPIPGADGTESEAWKTIAHKAHNGDKQAITSQDKARCVVASRDTLQHFLTGALEHPIVAKALCDMIAKDSSYFSTSSVTTNATNPADIPEQVQARMALIPSLVNLLARNAITPKN